MEDFQIILVVGFILIVMVLCVVLVIYKKKHQRSKEADSELRTYVDDNELAIISPAYLVIESKDENELIPEYMMMWFQRPESDR